MSFSIIGSSISESVTLKLNETAAILRAKGEPVIHLGGGEPKSKAPLDAIQAAAGLLSSGDIKTDLLITHEKPLKDVESALKMMGAGESMKIAITPG